MSTIKVPLDFDGVEDFEKFDAGVYPAVIEKLTYRPARTADETEDGKAKAASVSVEYVITDPELEGRKVWQNLYFTPKAMFRAARFFKVFDVDYRELDVDEETGIVLNPDLSGTAVEVKVIVDSYDDRNKVDEPPVPIGPKAPQRSAAARSDARSAGSEDKGRRGGRPIR